MYFVAGFKSIPWAEWATNINLYLTPSELSSLKKASKACTKASFLISWRLLQVWPAVGWVLRWQGTSFSPYELMQKTYKPIRIVLVPWTSLVKYFSITPATCLVIWSRFGLLGGFLISRLCIWRRGLPWAAFSGALGSGRIGPFIRKSLDLSVHSTFRLRRGLHRIVD